MDPWVLGRSSTRLCCFQPKRLTHPEGFPSHRSGLGKHCPQWFNFPYHHTVLS